VNRPFGVPALAGADRLKAGLQTRGVPTGRFMDAMHASSEGRLSKNLKAGQASRLPKLRPRLSIRWQAGRVPYFGATSMAEIPIN
jgi:hypothetical protein